MQGTYSNSSTFVPVINVKVAETATSCMAFEDNYLYRNLSIYRCNT